MKSEQFSKNISRIHELFHENEHHLNLLSEGVQAPGEQSDILKNFLQEMGLEENDETYYAAAARIGDKKFEPLDIYLEKQGKSQLERDEMFEKSYIFVAKYYEDLQGEMIEIIKKENLLPEFYETIFEYTHILGKLYSVLFLSWNRQLLFKTNRALEKRFDGDQDAIIAYMEKHDLFDAGDRGEIADRSYSILIPEGENFRSVAYSEVFQDEVNNIVSMYDEFVGKLQSLEDDVYDRKEAYIEYFTAIKEALAEKDTDNLVAKWSEVDVKWMAIDTPVQPGHPIEYYEDRYRRAVSIEFDMRLLDPSLFESEVVADIENMYEGMYDEIGRENFPESYEYSKKNFKKVQLYISSPILAYGSFLCGAYSAQVVPNDDEVSKVHGKKIFAFPKFVLESQRLAPKMKLDYEMISAEILEKYYEFLGGDDSNYYKIYDVETIGHEYGHTLWLAPGAEVAMGEKGLFKNIEEFKATAGGLVAYFLKGESDLDEAVIITHLMRSIKIMRYREVEDILPYYCECLIHLHILFESGIISYQKGKIELHMHEQNMKSLRELYIAVYTQQIFTYLHKMEAGNFLFEFVVKESGVYLPKDEEVREFVEKYYETYKQIGNTVLDSK